MKRFSLASFFIGIGIGMLFSFILITWNNNEDVQVDINEVPDEMIIERAKELGLVRPKEEIKGAIEDMDPSE